MVALISSHLAWRESFEPQREGNLPALLRPGPKRRGICLMRVSEAMKASYLAANFLIIFLFLLNFLRSSTLLKGALICSACSQWTALPSTQIFMLGRGTAGSLKVPLKRLSFAGS